MRAPKMPGHTCPTIDKLKRRIEIAHKTAEDAQTEEDAGRLKDMLADIANELNGEADTLEELRDANSALRECAEYWRAEAERLEAAFYS